MSRARVTKTELEREVAALRARVAELEAVEAERDPDEGAFDESRVELAAVFQTAPVMMMMLGADRRVREINRGFESVPTLAFPDGSTLTEPTAGELSAKLVELGYEFAPSTWRDRLSGMLGS